MAAPGHHTVESVVELGSSLLSSPPHPPLSAVVTARLLSLCVGLRQVGRHLEGAHAPTLRALLHMLAKLCRRPELELAVRLRLLEVVELGTLGWRPQPLLESYYRERLAMLGAPSDLCTLLEGGGEVAREGGGEVALMARGEEGVEGRSEETLVARGATLTIRSTEPAALAAAARVLREVFAMPQVGGAIVTTSTISTHADGPGGEEQGGDPGSGLLAPRGRPAAELGRTGPHPALGHRQGQGGRPGGPGTPGEPWAPGEPGGPGRHRQGQGEQQLPPPSPRLARMPLWRT